MDILHDEENKIIAHLSKCLQENIDTIEALFVDCADAVMRKFTIGGGNKVDIYIVYIDNMVSRELLEEMTIKNLVYFMDDLPKENQFEYIKEKGIRTADVNEILTLQDVTQAALSGDTAILVDGYDKAFKIASKGMPNRGVPEAESEVSVRGSKEGFSESIGINRVLIRRRIRDTKLKIKQQKVGIRSMTDVAIVYMEDIVKPELVEEITKRLKDFCIDGILDSGMLEQLTESSVYSPFPQFQSTERPDKAASAVLEGRVVVLVDNAPMALVLPTTLNSFFQASDDYYSRWEVVSFTRVLRYIAAFLAIALPGLYIAVVNYQSEMIPTSLTLSFAAARQGVPFSVVFEVILMELAFELLREAGIRLPGAMGNTIGIVGGLIIGDAAVNANLVSPMIVIVVAATAISAFAIPNEAFASAFRFTRYLVIFSSALLGLYGFLLGMMFILIHLAGLNSFGIPYLMPFVANSAGTGEDEKDAILRLPIGKLEERPIYARKGQKRRLIKGKKGKQ